jgi:hypothetical protein
VKGRGASVLGDYRHGGKADDFLADIILRPARHVFQQRRAGIAGDGRAERRALPGSPSVGTPNAGAISSVSRSAATWARSASWPHHQVAILGSLSGSPFSNSDRRGRKAAKAGASSSPDAGRVGDHDIALGHRIDHAGHADRRMRIERERIEQARIEPVPQRVDALQPAIVRT